MTVQDYQARQDSDHLNILSICYIVSGILILVGAFGMAAYFSLIGLIMAAAGASSGLHSGSPLPAGIFLFMAVFFALLIGAIGGLMLYAGKCIKQRQQITWVMVAAGLSCLHMPLGTLLGIFTFVVLSRPSVKALFAQP